MTLEKMILEKLDWIGLKLDGTITSPIMDFEPVRYGHWEWTDDPRTGDFVCSNCLEHNIVRSRYCPNCGAKMDGERKEDA